MPRTLQKYTVAPLSCIKTVSCMAYRALTEWFVTVFISLARVHKHLEATYEMYSPTRIRKQIRALLLFICLLCICWNLWSSIITFWFPWLVFPYFVARLHQWTCTIPQANWDSFLVQILCAFSGQAQSAKRAWLSWEYMYSEFPLYSKSFSSSTQISYISGPKLFS